MENQKIKTTTIFVDTSAFKALIDFSDDFNSQARKLWGRLSKQKQPVLTTNFVLDETYTLLRVRLGREPAIKFKQRINISPGFKRPQRVLAQDEVEAWKFFKELPGRGVSYTDCTSFAVMKRLGLIEVFTFDRDFARAGFKVLP
ncbi:MAG: PIN domain-containing protein [Candidatus Blackburnbacteria bacterium]|nr:PIN domain-containing protein [Candidatus Blackburnbacteria bacterium]